MFGINKYLILALLGCAIAAFSGWQGYKYGRDKINALWLSKEVVQVAEAAKQLEKLQNEARSKESLAAVELINIQNDLSEAQNEIHNKDSIIVQQYADIASLRWGSRSLQTSGSESGAVTASTRECDGETITEFSGELFEAIYIEFGKCDAIVNQLSACQQVLESDRKIFNEVSND